MTRRPLGRTLKGRKSEVSQLLDVCFAIHGSVGTRDIFDLHWGEADPNTRLRDEIWQILKGVFDEPRPSKSTRLNIIGNFISRISESSDSIKLRGLYRFLGNLIRSSVTDTHVLPADKKLALRHVAEVTRSFWDFAVGQSNPCSVNSREAFPSVQSLKRPW